MLRRSRIIVGFLVLCFSVSAAGFVISVISVSVFVVFVYTVVVVEVEADFLDFVGLGGGSGWV